MGELVFLLVLLFGYTSAIITFHHDKPENSSIPHMALQMNQNLNIFNITLDSNERYKRLLPYANFYQKQHFNQGQTQQVYEPVPPPRHRFAIKKIPSYPQSYQETVAYQNHPSNKKFTPFSENNAIPGPFRPMVTPQQQEVQFIRLPQIHQSKVPDYSAIYDQLSQLKLAQQYRRPSYQLRPVHTQNYLPEQPVRQRYKLIQPSKTTIETYTATSIDIPTPENSYEQTEGYRIPQKNYVNVVNVKPFVNSQIAIDVPQGSIPQSQQQHQQYETVVQKQAKPYIIVRQKPQEEVQKQAKPYILVHQKQEEEQFVRKPIVVIDKKLPPKYIPVQNYGYQTTPKYEDYEDASYHVTPVYERFPNSQVTPNYIYPDNSEEELHPQDSYQPSTENSNTLGDILKHLQTTNALPTSITADNIDNSIKTLVKILEALKKRRKLTKPIVVQDVNDYDEEDNEADIGGDVEDISELVSSYPMDTPEGGTPGKPGVDYPALSNIPQTSFNCKTQRYKGFFGDPDTNCQVWHYCDLNGGQASFLCPNGTIFSQVALTCDWWYNVKCSNTPQLYVLNERLYKYIIPLSPKFPEDYSGPLVDKYLALKFQEMEEKMRKEKKGKLREKEEEKEDSETEEDTKPESTEKVSSESTSSASSSHHQETLETIEEDNRN